MKIIHLTKYAKHLYISPSNYNKRYRDQGYRFVLIPQFYTLTWFFPT